MEAEMMMYQIIAFGVLIIGLPILAYVLAELWRRRKEKGDE